MIEFLISCAIVLCLAGCVYAACLILAHAQGARSGAVRKLAKMQAPGRLEAEFRNPSLGYYI
jgi:hypothetical protein